jgi:VIT1/CCC1 family predicted Fe2+/Mn2+ transporter
MTDMIQNSGQSGVDEAQWFRPPTRRERVIAAGLFFGFGAFFFVFSFVWRGSWFRWVIVGLGVWSVVYALGHLMRLRRS